MEIPTITEQFNWQGQTLRSYTTDYYSYYRLLQLLHDCTTGILDQRYWLGEIHRINFNSIHTSY